MRPWISGGVGAVVAAVVGLLVVRPLEPGSPATVTLVGLAIFAAIVVLLSAGVFVAGLSRVCRRLREPPRTCGEWESAFARTGLSRLSHRLLDVANAGGPGYQSTLLVQSRFDPSSARREVRALFRDYLTRAQFFTAFVLLLASCGLSAAQASAAMQPGAVVLPLLPSVAVTAAVLIVAVLCLFATESATERFLDVLRRVPTEPLERGLLRVLATLAERTNEPQLPASGAAVPAHIYDPGLARLGALLERMMNSLQSSADRLAANTELLQSAIRPLSDQRSGEAAPLEERTARELKIALERLTRALERLPSRREGTSPAEPTVAAGSVSHELETSVSKPQAARDLGREVHELLKEFE